MEINNHKPNKHAPKKIKIARFDKLGLLALTIIKAEARINAAIIIANTKRFTILFTSILFLSQFKISKLSRVLPFTRVSSPFLREVGNSKVSEDNWTAFRPRCSSVRCLNGEKPLPSLR